MFRHAIAAIAASALASGVASAQRPSDTTRTDSASRSRGLEGVIVRAVRANGSAPIAQTSIGTAQITRRSFAQDVPLMLQGTTPSLTAHAESGSNWGYSYLRLRGMDQSRINLSIDGIPLNDPEDQVFYFANFADLASSVQSVQVQRGVGTSGTGTASFAGSINFETKPVFGVRRQVATELQVGSFGARRVMLEANSGTTQSGFAASARFSALRTNSFRRNAGLQGVSGLAQAGWIGARNMVKVTLLAGQLRDTLSYLAVPLSDLQRDRRINPLTPEEQDRFTQTLLAVSHTNQLTPALQIASTVYRIAASGNYDVRFDSTTIGNYGLDFGWYGVTSAMNLTRSALTLNVGVNANTYSRDHAAYVRPDLVNNTYLNTGHKTDGSAFAKITVVNGPLTWFSDLQVRRSLFRYAPNVGSGFVGRDPSTSWTFFNPRVGLTASVRPNMQLFASLGRTTREPTRSDMLAGNDDISQSALTDLGGFQRVRPEQVVASEGGIRWRGRTTRVELNAFRMDFRNEIARIGALSPLGAELRSNVGASVRQGLELEAHWTPTRSVTSTTVASASRNRIRQFVDSTGPLPIVRRNVPPLLAPAISATQRIDWRAARWLELGMEARYQSESFLRNDGDRALVLPAFTMLDAIVRIPLASHDLSVRTTNLGNSQKFGSGYAVSGVPNYFILPPRSIFVTLRIALQ